jgi:hypothetical protein
MVAFSRHEKHPGAVDVKKLRGVFFSQAGWKGWGASDSGGTGFKTDRSLVRIKNLDSYCLSIASDVRLAWDAKLSDVLHLCNFLVREVADDE